MRHISLYFLNIFVVFAVLTTVYNCIFVVSFTVYLLKIRCTLMSLCKRSHLVTSCKRTQNNGYNLEWKIGNLANQILLNNNSCWQKKYAGEESNVYIGVIDRYHSQNTSGLSTQDPVFCPKERPNYYSKTPFVLITLNALGSHWGVEGAIILPT